MILKETRVELTELFSILTMIAITTLYTFLYAHWNRHFKIEFHSSSLNQVLETFLLIFQGLPVIFIPISILPLPSPTSKLQEDATSRINNLKKRETTFGGRSPTRSAPPFTLSQLLWLLLQIAFYYTRVF